MTPEKIPYPARRTYLWAYPDEMHTYEKARDIFVRMRRQAPEHDNPARFKALTLTLEAIAHLSHNQGIDKFPGPKLHKLLCKSALAADWCPDLNAKQRAACPQHVKVDPETGQELYKCPKCNEVKPVSEFLKPVTAAQRRLWGWDNAYASRTTKAKTCRTCRHKAQQRSVKQATAAQARQALRKYERAILSGALNVRSAAQSEGRTPELLSIVYDYWQALLNKVMSSTRASRHTAALSPHEPTLSFYDLKMEMLLKAKENFDIAAEAGQLIAYTVPSPHWTMLLNKDDLITLQFAHAHMTTARRDELVRGRTPSI